MSESARPQLSKEQLAKAKLIHEFRKTTEAEHDEILNALLAPAEAVVEFYFPFCAKPLHFKRMSHGDLQEFYQLAKDGHASAEVDQKTCELLAKYNQDGIASGEWLKMADKQRGELESIFKNVLALTYAGADEEERLKFFRAVTDGTSVGNTVS